MRGRKQFILLLHGFYQAASHESAGTSNQHFLHTTCFNRYPISLDGYENGNEKIDIFYAEISKRDGNISLTDKRARFTSAEELSEIDKWTICEAILKCDGIGFCGLKNFGEIQKKSKVSVFKISHEDKIYSLTIAVSN
jgi:hypothetical protein